MEYWNDGRMGREEKRKNGGIEKHVNLITATLNFITL